MGIDRYVTVSFGCRTCLAEVQAKPHLEGLGRVCGLDENLRIRLAMPSIEPGVELYGACVSLTPVDKKSIPRRFLRPRRLVLSLNRTTSIDAEKDICAIDRAILDLLGGEPGDKLRISSFSKEGKEMTISRRAMCGSTGRWDYWPEDFKYPALGAIHLDAGDRELLGLAAETDEEFRQKCEGYPLLVSVDMGHQLRKRVVLYSFSLLSTVVGITVLSLSIFRASLGAEKVASLVPAIAGVAVIASCLIVAGIIHLDIKSRVSP